MSAPYIPATALDGTLIAGWSGPCEVLAHARFPVALPDAAHLAMLQGKSAWVSCFLSLDACAGESLPRRNVCLDRGQNFSFDPSRCRMRLDPRREEVASSTFASGACPRVCGRVACGARRPLPASGGSTASFRTMKGAAA